MNEATLGVTPGELAGILGRLGVARACFVRDEISGELRASPPAFAGLAAEIAAALDFDGHEAAFFEVGAETGTLFTAFLHRTIRGQGAGGVRFWQYDTMAALVQDGLRLSRGMGRKNALAGLWWGGGKGIIARTSEPGPMERARIFREYGRFITSLRGAYVTAEDAGTQAADMAEIFRATRFVTCVPPEVGGSGDPSFATARGVICAMEGALDFLEIGTLAGKTVAMQGFGNVGAAMIDELLERDVERVIAADISESRRSVLEERLAGRPVELRVVAPGDDSIVDEPCDVFAPNALGGTLHSGTIPRLRCRVVCGAANNQLLDEERDSQALEERGITYVPDYLANRMGIVGCSNEQYGSLAGDPAIERHFGRDWVNAVFVICRRVLERARDSGTTPREAADRLADELAVQEHPIWGHRTRAILDGLLRDGWAPG